jgi:magnesium-transporting ATPase (P-type)
MYNYDLSLLLRFLFITAILFGILLAFAFLAFIIWMLIDCINRDEKDFKDRTLWIILLIIGILSGYSWILSIVYYFAIKRKLDR